MPKLRFHVAFAAWQGLPRVAATLKARDEVLWACSNDIDASTSIGGDASIGRWRSHTAEAFMRLTDLECLVMVDHDQAWMPGSVERVVATSCEARSVVAAAISKRRHGAGLACRPADGHKIKPGEDLVIPAKSVGAGFLAIHRSVFERLIDHTDEVEGFGGVDSFRTYFMEGVAPTPSGGKMWLGEDKAFCIRCKAAGVPLLIDCFPRVDHIGDYAFTAKDALAAQAAKDDQ